MDGTQKIARKNGIEVIELRKNEGDRMEWRRLIEELSML